MREWEEAVKWSGWVVAGKHICSDPLVRLYVFHVLHTVGGWVYQLLHRTVPIAGVWV